MFYLDVQNSSYRSPESALPAMTKAFPSLIFYTHFVKILFSAARLSKKGIFTDEEWGVASHQIIRRLEQVGVQFEIEGLENLEQLESGPCVFAANHMSMMETLVLPSIILPYMRVTYVIKQSLLEYPVFKHIMRSRDPVAVTRINPREDLKTVLTEGKKRLEQGISVIIFPQTTRALSFDPEHFGSIATKLARQADVPMVPVALKTDAWTNGRFIKDFGRIQPYRLVRFSFGKPLAIQGKGNEEHRQTADFISGRLTAWREKEERTAQISVDGM